ncbi:hypothetical protein BKA19_3623 [Blastococcus saxobsidens]|uniref:Uncharacterized protein n=1 Tax=Blastococcus saxobsidens TaxID=138336 RepID=A0A4Q7YBR1_9ACTN|nr:hypothetical protein BKA19_3623 [Blastococcus saxobsidens]
MSSTTRAPRPASAHVSPEPGGRAATSTLAGLIDVLDRADGVRPRQRSATHRTAGRPGPLRSVQPAPRARSARVPAVPVPRVVVVPDRVRRPLGGVRGLVRRVALWGAGEQGEYLAWHLPAHTRPGSTPGAPAAPPGRRRGALRDLHRRAALWGAGDRGEYLAWGPSAARPVRRDLDPPVVLRELPSIPTIAPVASSPAPALLPAEPASSPGTRTGTAASDATARPPTLPSSTEPSARSQPRVGSRPPRDWPSSGRYWARSTPPSLPVRSSGPMTRTSAVPAPRAPRGSGDTRARGDPLPGTARGSPPPPRRHGPANGLPPEPFSARAPSSHSLPAPPAPPGTHSARPRQPAVDAVSRTPSSTPRPVAHFPG